MARRCSFTLMLAVNGSHISVPYQDRGLVRNSMGSYQEMVHIIMLVFNRYVVARHKLSFAQVCDLRDY